MNCFLIARLRTWPGTAHMKQDALHVGFIGLGHMGHGMAVNIVKRGFPLQVMAHRSRNAIDDLVQRGASEVSSPKTMAAYCDIVILCVPGAKEVEALVADDDGLAAGAKPGLTIVDCTTSEPSTLLRLAGEYAPSGLVFVDAPLGRSPHEAWLGTLSTMVGGELSALERIRPCSLPSPTQSNMRARLGMVTGSSWSTTSYRSATRRLYSEALTLAVKAGLDAASFDNLVRSSRMHCEFYDTFIGWVVSGDSQSHPYALDDALRTISDVVQFSRSARVNGRLASSVRDIYAEAVADGFSAAMLPELPRAVALANDVDLKPMSEVAPP